MLVENAKAVKQWEQTQKGRQVKYTKGPGMLCHMEGVDDQDCIDLLRRVSFACEESCSSMTKK